MRDLKLLASKPESSLDKAEFDKLNTEISYIIGVPYLIVSFEEVANLNLDQLCCFFIAQFWLTYDLKEIEFETRSPGLIRLLEKSSLLSQIDIAWKSHLQKMDILRDSIGWRSYGQLDPLLEYKNEAFNLFIDNFSEIEFEILSKNLSEIFFKKESKVVINLGKQNVEGIFEKINSSGEILLRNMGKQLRVNYGEII